MTNLVPNITDIAGQMAAQNDRHAFFVALVVLAGVIAWLVKWLVGLNQKLADTLDARSQAYQTKLEEIVKNQTTVTESVTIARVEQTQALRESTAALQENTATLATARDVLKSAGHVTAVFLLSVFLFAGCVFSKDGRVIGVTQSVIGIDIGQTSADAVPHVRLGYVRSQFHVVPTGSNVYAPAVLSSMSVDNTFSHQVIDEDFATGGATRDVSPTSPAATGAKARSERKK